MRTQVPENLERGRAQILLAADAGRSDEEIARTVAVGGSTVYRTKRRFVEGNLERQAHRQGRSLAGGNGLRGRNGTPLIRPKSV
jgi:transposase